MSWCTLLSAIKQNDDGLQLPIMLTRSTNLNIVELGAWQRPAT